MSENKEQSKFKRFAVTAFWYLFASIFVAIVFYLLFALLFSTQEEKRLGKENRLYSSLYDDMSARLELIGDVVEGLTGRDAAIYEELFDTQPPMADVVTNLREPASYAEDLSEVQYVKIATRLSDSLMSKASRIDGNFAEVFRLIGEKPDSIPPLSLPIKDMSYVQTGASIGLKHNPVHRLQLPHEGLDLVAPQGAAVYAAAGGLVSKVEISRKGLGNTVEIDHGNGYVTRYTLLGDIKAVRGRKVRTGQEIGTVGISTSVSAPHLHFEVLKDGKVMDPVNYVFASVSPADYVRMLYLSAKTSQSMD